MGRFLIEHFRDDIQLLMRKQVSFWEPFFGSVLEVCEHSVMYGLARL